MLDKKYWKIIFIIMAAAQLYFPLQLIWSSEQAIKEGTVYKFKTVPVDPFDPFRGKYIRLRFDVEREKFNFGSSVSRNREIYALLDKDAEGYASVSEVRLEKPDDDIDYVKVTGRSVGNNQINIDLPFDRFYMEESLALPAEQYVRSRQRDSTEVVYGLVHVLDDQAVLSNIMVNDEPIADVVRRNRVTK